MPIFQRSVKTIQHADDGPGTLGAGEDTEALTWDNATGHFITNPGGGGTTDHAALTNLDYANSGHTGFAATGVVNTFTRKQTLQSSTEDISLSSDWLDNPDFADDLSWWIDTDSAGWTWDAGAAIKPPGLGGSLTQSGIGITEGYLYVFAVQITSMTAGSVEARVIEGESTSIYLAFSENGTQQAAAVLTGPTVDIAIYADEFFDGRVEYVSLKNSNDGYPANITLKDFSGNTGGSIKAASNKLMLGNTSDPTMQTIQLAAQIIDISALPTSAGATGTAWVDEADGNTVKRA